MSEEDFRRWYDLEACLFDGPNSISQRFRETQQLSPFDFFCIVIWKANRAKSRIAKHLLHPDDGAKFADYEAAINELVRRISDARNPQARLRVLLNWGFYLPIASAILTVLSPEEFTVYDFRACNILGDFHKLAGKKDDGAVDGYFRYLDAVRRKTPVGYSLREKDRWLWGKSFHDDLKRDVAMMFAGPKDRTPAN
jgi:hypothetical protein